TSITYKCNDTGWYDERRTHLFVVDAATGSAKQITSGEDRNDADPQWSPDGTKIAFASEDTNKPILMNGDIWVVSSSGGAPTRINEAQEFDKLPRWSPDGKRVAYAAAMTASDLLK